MFSFDWQVYHDLNPDLEFITPEDYYLHWIQEGIYENRPWKRFTKKYKLVILVIASLNHPIYHHFLSIWHRFANLYEDRGIKVFFIWQNNGLSRGGIYSDHNNIYVPSSPNMIPGILDKTIQSAEYVFNHMEFDYIMRTNLSTFWYLPKLLEKVDQLINAELSFLYGGYVLENMFHSPKTDYHVISGTGIFLSRNMVAYMLIHRDKIDYQLIDDVAIGKFVGENMPEALYNLHECGFERFNIDFNRYVDLTNVYQKYFYYRIKNNNRDVFDSYYFDHLYHLFYSGSGLEDNKNIANVVEVATNH